MREDHRDGQGSDYEDLSVLNEGVEFDSKKRQEGPLNDAPRLIRLTFWKDYWVSRVSCNSSDGES